MWWCLSQQAGAGMPATADKGCTSTGWEVNDVCWDCGEGMDLSWRTGSSIGTPLCFKIMSIRSCFLYPFVTSQAISRFIHRLAVWGVGVLRLECAGKRKTPLRGESERVLAHLGHSTSAMPLSRKRIPDGRRFLQMLMVDSYVSR